MKSSNSLPILLFVVIFGCGIAISYFLFFETTQKLSYWIDLRVITTSFKAEKTLTKDTVPVDVDAVLFWQVLDPTKTALEVEDYKNAISWASQTALRKAYEHERERSKKGDQAVDKNTMGGGEK